MDLSDSYALPGNLSVDGSRLESWPSFVAHTFHPEEVNCTVRYDYSTNEMALFAWHHMGPEEEFLTDFQRIFSLTKSNSPPPEVLRVAIPWGRYSTLELLNSL